jgi:hypothetical protein
VWSDAESAEVSAAAGAWAFAHVVQVSDPMPAERGNPVGVEGRARLIAGSTVHHRRRQKGDLAGIAANTRRTSA